MMRLKLDARSLWMVALLVAVLGLALTAASCSSDEETTTTTTARVEVTTTTTVLATTTSTVTTEAVSTTATQPPVTLASGEYASPLTGEPMSKKSDRIKPVVGVMIDNLGPARPQSGIKDAEVVFEAIAEAGITRFLFMYQQHEPKLIGPVRSLRIYDIDWAMAFDASISHVGGAPSALTVVRDGKHRDLDMLRSGNSRFYWRSNDRPAPHNVYTSYEKLFAFMKGRGFNVSQPAPFSRTDGKPNPDPDVTSITIDISSKTYGSSYTYDKATNTYARYQGGTPFVDREAGQVKPSVVVALLVKEWQVIENKKTRERIGTIGSGKAVIFQNGTAAEVTWHKASVTAQLTFTDAAGNDVPLVRGQTWIVAVPNDRERVTWK